MAMRDVIEAVKRWLWMRRLRRELIATAKKQMAMNLRILNARGPEHLKAEMRKRYAHRD